MGDTYIKQVGKYDGDLQSNAFHPECHKSMEEYFAQNRDEIEFSPHECKRGTNEFFV